MSFTFAARYPDSLGGLLIIPILIVSAPFFDFFDFLALGAANKLAAQISATAIVKIFFI